jgi:hypothetical protein
MHHAAGTTRQHHNPLRLNALDRQTERMHRPTLLEKGSTADNLCHQLSSQSKQVVSPVHLVCLVDLVHLVSFVQPKNQTN